MLQNIFGDHLFVQPTYSMSSLCGRSELGRFLLCQMMKGTDIPLWQEMLTVPSK
jgi:hypothetical protein